MCATKQREHVLNSCEVIFALKTLKTFGIFLRNEVNPNKCTEMLQGMMQYGTR